MRHPPTLLHQEVSLTASVARLGETSRTLRGRGSVVGWDSLVGGVDPGLLPGVMKMFWN